MVADIINYSSVRVAEEKYLKSQGFLYKKTTSNSEKVAGLAAALASDPNYAEIKGASSGKVIGVFDKQRVPGYDSNQLLSDYYARDGFPVDIIIPYTKATPVRAYISASQTIAKFDKLIVDNGGTFSKYESTGTVVAIALEAITTTGSPDLIEILLLPIWHSEV